MKQAIFRLETGLCCRYNLIDNEAQSFSDLKEMMQMSEKRRDFKGRILKVGESQRKDGKYEYKYTDERGKRHSIYSWRLVDSDPVPAGKKKTESLRSMIKEIEMKRLEGISLREEITFSELFEMFMKSRQYVKERTISHYNQIYKNHLCDRFGKMKIKNIKYSTVISFYNDLIVKGYSYQTIIGINTIVNGCFNLAVRDDLINKNPCFLIVQDIKKAKNNPSKQSERIALSEAQQSIFLNYVASTRYRRYYPLFVFMFGTGCRIGEVIGLRWENVDFEKEMITIDHQMTFFESNGIRKNRISSPKTEKGNRLIPMLPDVKRALIAERKEQIRRGLRCKEEVDGYGDFVFITLKGSVYNAKNIASLIDRIVKEYNTKELQLSIKEKREAVLLPKISPHIFRHTFCTRLCEKKIELKTIQYVMGHETIETTLNVYAKVSEKMLENSADEMFKKVKVIL